MSTPGTLPNMSSPQLSGSQSGEVAMGATGAALGLPRGMEVAGPGLAQPVLLGTAKLIKRMEALMRDDCEVRAIEDIWSIDALLPSVDIGQKTLALTAQTLLVPSALRPKRSSCPSPDQPDPGTEGQRQAPGCRRRGRRPAGLLCVSRSAIPGPRTAARARHQAAASWLGGVESWAIAPRTGRVVER